MKILIRSILMTVFISGCVSSEKQLSVRAPSGEPVSSLELSQVSPTVVLESLKKHCCQGVVVEKTEVAFWGEAEISQLQKHVNDNSPAAPVYRSTSPVICTGTRFVSTVGREARHLIAAIKKGVYPLAQCSTYDLKL